MIKCNHHTFKWIFVVFFMAATLAQARNAAALLNESGVTGGLVVHVGCGDGTLTAALRANDRYIVHGLAATQPSVEKARRHIHAAGFYGSVSVTLFEGARLPYLDDMVNLLIVEASPMPLPAAEIARVLVPRGVALIQGVLPEDEPLPASLSRKRITLAGKAWIKLTKAVPEDIDEWTHFRHDAGGNAVAQDKRIGPPTRLRWVSDPRWCRSHEFPSSVSAVVVAHGRIFTIFDEAPQGVFRNLPQNYKLIARDAGNGALLWKVPLQKWQPELGTGLGNRWQIHHTIPRRLIARGNRVYATLKFLDAPVSVLDAATGKVLVEALPGTEGADEMVLSRDTLFVKTTPKLSPAATARLTSATLTNALAAVNISTGKQAWEKPGTGLLPHTLAALEDRVVYHTLTHLVCLDGKTGNEIWQVEDPVVSTVGAGSTLVIKSGVVLFNGRGRHREEKTGKLSTKAGQYLRAFALADGRFMWQHTGGRGWAAACTLPTDVFVCKDVVWCGTTKVGINRQLTGINLHSGTLTDPIALAKLVTEGHHLRCHHAKATEDYLILPKRGAEFVSLTGDDHMRHNWLRAPCYTGTFPANGLLYVPPSQCFCYPGVNLFGYLALASGDATPLKPVDATAVQKGDAYGGVTEAAATTAQDWPMYRRDALRSGSTKATVPADLSTAWSIKLTTRGTQPVVVGERLWVAEKDAHALSCMATATGKTLWRFTADGRIDSAPTYHGGTLIFGCRDGCVYCVRATDGALVWRFRAAPKAQWLMAREQVESAWPVSGSVLVQDGLVYFAAGRSSFLDGGILVYALDAGTGIPRHSHILEGPRPDIQKDNGRPFAMEGALPDLMVSDRDKNLYMMRIKFDPRLNRIPVRRESPLGELDMGALHLSATGGFLDDTGFDRVYWMYGKRWPGFYFAQQSPKAGQLVVFDDATTYAVKYFYRRHLWSPLLIPGDQGYLLFADDNNNEPGFLKKGKESPKMLAWLPKASVSDKHRRGGQGVEKGTGYVRHAPEKWQAMIPLRVRAMVLAGDRLFAAGVPDVVDPEDPFAAFEGRKGGMLHVYSAKNGALLKSMPMPSEPAFDGMSAARGSLFIATLDGRVLRLTGQTTDQ